MQQLALRPLEFIINRALSLDSDTLQQLKPLHGKLVEVRISDWNYKVYLSIQHSQLQLLQHSNKPANTCLRGKLFDFGKLMLQGANANSMRKNNIQVDGDMDLAQSLQTIFQKLDLDWEEQLSKLIGDSAAYHAGNTWRKLKSFIKNTHQHIGASSDEYITEELQLTPSTKEAEHFYAEIQQLRDDVARFSAKIDTLSTNPK